MVPEPWGLNQRVTLPKLILVYDAALVDNLQRSGRGALQWIDGETGMSYPHPPIQGAVTGKLMQFACVVVVDISHGSLLKSWNSFRTFTTGTTCM